MGSTGIALMLGETILRVLLMQLDHHRVARYFSDNRCRGDGEAKLVAFHDGLLVKRRDRRKSTLLKQLERNRLIAVDKQTIRLGLECVKSLHHREQTGLQNIDAIDLVYFNDTQPPTFSVFANQRRQVFALFGRK